MFSGQILADNARNIFEFCLFSSMASDIVRQNTNLSNFTRVRHDRVLEKFKELDKEIIKSNRN